MIQGYDGVSILSFMHCTLLFGVISKDLPVYVSNDLAFSDLPVSGTKIIIQ